MSYTFIRVIGHDSYFRIAKEALVTPSKERIDSDLIAVVFSALALEAFINLCNRSLGGT